MIPYSGFHFQRPINDWPRAAVQLPAGTWIKFIDNVQALDEAKRVNPGVKTVLRHWDGGWHQFEKGTLEAYKAHARAFFDTFIDNTFMDYAHNVDAIEGLNEFNAASHNSAEIAERVKWVQASCMVWANEYRTRAGLGHIRLVSSNTAVGNDIPLEAARAIADYGAIAAYHPYVPTQNKQIRSGEWQWYSGRWTEMDKRYRAAGITVEWLFTEAGPIGYTGEHLLANDGWRHANVCGGDVNALLAVVKYWMDRATLWNYEHGGRALGQVLYNSGGADNEWKLFEIAQPNMDTVAAFNRNYVPPPPPKKEPPPPPDNIPTPAGVIDIVDELPMNPESEHWPYKTRPLSAIENVVIHHSVGQPTTPPESIAIGHINRGWPAIGYHFYINVDSNGEARIYKTNHLTTHSYHAGTANYSSVGVCLAGDFTAAHPSPKQLAAARYLLTWLDDVLGFPNLIKHRDVSATQCPGNSWEAWWSQLTEEPEPPTREWSKLVYLLPQNATREQYNAIADIAYPTRSEIAFSADAAFARPSTATKGHHVIVYDVDAWGGRQLVETWRDTYYLYNPATVTEYRNFPGIEPQFAAPVGTDAERASGQIWPGDWVSANTYLNYYRYGSSNQYEARHTGDDLNLNKPSWNSDRKKPVYAMTDGTVTFAERVANSTWGRLVVIRHASDLHSRYAHMATLLVGPGDRVQCGDIIGTIGGTEYGVADHLHFDISTSGVLETRPTDWPGMDSARILRDYVNPKTWLQERV